MGKGLGWAGRQTREETDLGPGGGLVSSGHVALSPGSLFLVRESQRNPQGFVLSLCHVQKVKHYLILPVSIPASCRTNAGLPAAHPPHTAPRVPGVSPLSLLLHKQWGPQPWPRRALLQALTPP